NRHRAQSGRRDAGEHQAASPGSGAADLADRRAATYDRRQVSGSHSMKHRYSLILAAAVAASVAACSTTPETIEELETARAVVPQVEASPRAGVAVTNITDARKALDRANALAEKHGKVADSQYEAAVANRNAQIANENILAAQARDDVEKGTLERQAVLTEARGRE